ncbi:MAG: SoxR reducing system RseC family protein [Nitrospirota bacterium]|jgi:sigma-E factor negative regulatory protein RseC
MALLLEEGRVVSVEGETAQVSVARGSACGGCAQEGACNPLDPAGQEIVIRVDNALDARPGQRVVVGVEEGMVLRGAAWVYALPLATFFLGYWLGGAVAPAGEGESGTAIAGAMLGLGAGLATVYWRFRRKSVVAAYRPRMVKAL